MTPQEYDPLSGVFFIYVYHSSDSTRVRYCNAIDLIIRGRCSCLCWKKDRGRSSEITRKKWVNSCRAIEFGVFLSRCVSLPARNALIFLSFSLLLFSLSLALFSCNDLGLSKGHTLPVEHVRTRITQFPIPRRFTLNQWNCGGAKVVCPVDWKPNRWFPNYMSSRNCISTPFPDHHRVFYHCSFTLCTCGQHPEARSSGIVALPPFNRHVQLNWEKNKSRVKKLLQWFDFYSWKCRLGIYFAPLITK